MILHGIFSAERREYRQREKEEGEEREKKNEMLTRRRIDEYN